MSLGQMSLEQMIGLFLSGMFLGFILPIIFDGVKK